VEFGLQQDIAETGDKGQRRYEDKRPARRRTIDGLNHAMNTVMEAKKTKLNVPFMKHLTIANLANGKEFLDEVSQTYSCCQALNWIILCLNLSFSTLITDW
jgi:hypothetical protein